MLREPLPCRTGCALALLVAVGVVFTPRLLSLQGGGYTAGPYSLAGDLLAIFTGAAQGASLTVNRHAAVHAPKATSRPRPLSSLLATVSALYLRATTRMTRDFWECAAVWRAFLSLAAADAIAVACFYVALFTPRYITGGEVALITLLEVVLGPSSSTSASVRSRAAGRSPARAERSPRTRRAGCTGGGRDDAIADAARRAVAGVAERVVADPAQRAEVIGL